MSSPTTTHDTPEHTFVVLARIGRPHGVRGWLNVDLVGNHLREFVGCLVNLAAGEFTPILHNPTVKKTLRLTGAKPEHGTVKHIAFEGVTDRDAAVQLTNLLLALPLGALQDKARAQRVSNVAPLPELWYFEMYGLRVRDAENHELVGYIVAIEDLGRNTIISVALHRPTGKATTLAIPLEYPHWGKADLDRGEIPLAEWRQFVGA